MMNFYSWLLNRVFDSDDFIEDHYRENFRKAILAYERRMKHFAEDSRSPMEWSVKCKTCGKFETDGKVCTHCTERRKAVFNAVKTANAKNRTGINDTGWDDGQIERCKALIMDLILESKKKSPTGSGKAWKNRSVLLNAVNERVAKDIKLANPMMRASSGTDETVDIEQLVHAIREHGDSARHRQPFEVAISEEDLKLIPEILSDYDIILPGLGKREGKQREGVEFWKMVGDGYYQCISVDSFDGQRNKNTLKFQTMLKFKEQSSGSLA